MITAAIALALNLDVEVAGYVANNALRNNFAQFALLAAVSAFDAYEQDLVENRDAIIDFMVEKTGMSREVAATTFDTMMQTGRLASMVANLIPGRKKAVDGIAKAGRALMKKGEEKANAAQVKEAGQNKGELNGPTHADYATPEAAHSLRIDPHTNKGPMSIDSSLFTKATSRTSEGAARNQGQFWELWNQKYPGRLSETNLKRIQNEKAPRVDEHWVQHFPEHQNFLGQGLEHHHLDHGHLAVPLPKSLHRGKGNSSVWHSNGDKKL